MTVPGFPGFRFPRGRSKRRSIEVQPGPQRALQLERVGRRKLVQADILTVCAALNNVARLTRNDDSSHARYADNLPLASRKVNK